MYEHRLQAPSRTIPTILQKAFYPSLDGMRAISILLVLFAHLSDRYPFSADVKMLITMSGQLGVQIFFVISGFLITTLLLKEKAVMGNISLRNFYIRRAFRILPLVFLYLLVLLIWNQVFHLEVPLRCFAGAAFFLANISAFKGSWYTAHFWSLSTEEQYYLFFPFLLKKWGKWIHVMIIFLLLLISFIKEAAYLQIPLFPPSDTANTIGFLLFQSDGVLIGSLLSVLWFKNYLPVAAIKKYSRLLQATLPLLIFIVYTGWVPLHSFNSLLATLLIAIWLASVVSLTKGLVFFILNNKVIATIGRLSFSIYIWQQLFTSPDGRFGSFSRLPKNLLVIAVVSCLSYYFIEKRFLKLKKRFKNVGARML